MHPQQQQQQNNTTKVYSRAAQTFDPEKKGGRWQPEYIWNTNWQETLKRKEDLERQQAEYLARGGAAIVAVGDGVE